MKTRIPTLLSILGMSLLTAGTAWAQTQTQPPSTPSTSPTQSMPSMPSTTSAPPSAGTTNNNPAAGSATYNTAQGQVTVDSKVPPVPSTASPPSFEQLANGKKYITKEDANAYPPLANDFLYASHNGNRISKAQYERWVKHLN